MITKNIKGLKKASYVGLTALSIALSLERPILGADEVEKTDRNCRDCMGVVGQIVAGGAREMRQNFVNPLLREMEIPKRIEEARDFLQELGQELGLIN